MAYDNTNRISIWRNNEKREGRQDADFTGTVNVNGVEFYVNLWARKPDANPKAPALSGNIKEKGKREAPKAEAPEVPEFDDDLTF